MHQSLNTLLRALGAWPPLRFVLVLAAAEGLLQIAFALGAPHLDPALAAGLLWGTRAVSLLVFTVAAWHRPDSPIECGLLVAGVFLLANAVEAAVVAAVLSHSYTAAIIALIFAPFRVVLSLALLVPIAGGLVWLARVIVPPKAAASGPAARRPHHSSPSGRPA